MKSAKCTFSFFLLTFMLYEMSISLLCFIRLIFSFGFWICTWLCLLWSLHTYISHIWWSWPFSPKTPSAEKIYVDCLLWSVTIFQQRIDKIFFRRIQNSRQISCLEVVCKMATKTWMYVIFIRSRCYTLKFSNGCLFSPSSSSFGFSFETLGGNLTDIVQWICGLAMTVCRQMMNKNKIKWIESKNHFIGGDDDDDDDVTYKTIVYANIHKWTI